MKRRIVYFVFLLFVLQSCTIYTKTAVPIQDAEGKGKVKVISDQKVIYRFDDIVRIDSTYYGIKNNSLTVLTEHVFNGIYPKHKEKSTNATFFAVIGGGLGVGFIVLVIIILHNFS